MDTQQPLINTNYPNNNYNFNNTPQNNQYQYQNTQRTNPAPVPVPYYQNTNINTQKNATPQEVYQYPNSADFPQYNQIENTNQPQVDYSKYTHINQLNHRGIKQTNNTFKVSKRCCSMERWFPMIYFSFSLLLASVVFWTEVNFKTVIISIFGFFFASLGLIMLCKFYYTVYITLNPTNIKVTETGWCGWKSTFYGSGQITEIHFNSAISPGVKGEEYVYQLFIYQNIPGKEPEFVLFADRYKKVLYTEEEIGYFNYVVNHHIQTNLGMQNMN